MFKSGGVFTKDPVDVPPGYHYFGPMDWNGVPQPGITQAFRWASYEALYERQLWVGTLVDKIANATARLPLKVYQRADMGRPEARKSPYAILLRQPSSKVDTYKFWRWVVTTLNVHGATYLLKRRDRGGRPVELVPFHPTNVTQDMRDDGVESYTLTTPSGRTIDNVPRRDLVIFSLYGGVSPLEQLRSTLENEDGSRTANSALWRNGARPSMVLRHPMKLSKDAQERLGAAFDSRHTGAANFARVPILEEGMEAQTLSFNSRDLQYVDTRRLNREECCARYDVPPPVVHILDHATFSNIEEQMRSMYRDTMAPKLKGLEATLEFDLRDGRFGRGGEPDFSDSVYAEFLMDEVLRGAFEARMEAYQKAVNSGIYMPAEVREKENLPPADGADRLFVNSTMIPIDQAVAEPEPEQPPAEVVPLRPLPALSSRSARTVNGRCARAVALAEVDPELLIMGIPEALVIRSVFDQARSQGWSVSEFRQAVQAAVVDDEPQQPTMNVTVPVTVHTGEHHVTVEPTNVSVMAETPDVHVPVEVTVPERSVTVESPGVRVRHVERDSNGHITKIVEE